MCRWDQKGGGDTELEQGSGYVHGDQKGGGDTELE